MAPPATAMTWSLSVMHTKRPVDCAMASAYCTANEVSSIIGEYFLRMISPSLSVNISNGVPSLSLNVLRISLGITTLPRSSILLTIPVAFINKIPPFYFLSFIFFVARKCSICKTEEFILKVTFKVNMRL